MAGVNPKWQRWTYASIAKHAHTYATAGAWILAVEFLDDLTKQTAAWEAAATRTELSISGPIVRQTGPTTWAVLVTVFVVVTSKRSNNDYDHLDVVGKVQEALDQCIQVKDYGDTGAVDIGTLTPARSVPIEPVHIRPAETDDQIFSTVAATYDGLFST